MSRIPSTSIGTRSSACSARAASSTSSRNGLPCGGRISGCAASVASSTGSRTRSASDDGTSPTRSSSRRCSTTQARIGDRFGHHRAREHALGDVDREPLRRALGEPQRQPGRDPAHLDDQRGHERTTHGSDDTERRVTGLEPLQHRQVLAQRLDLAANGPGPVDHPHAELGRHRPPAAAHEQLHAELGLELVDVTRYVRLHRVEAVGRGRERTLFGDGEQRFELANVHARRLRAGRGAAAVRICFTDGSYLNNAFDR